MARHAHRNTTSLATLALLAVSALTGCGGFFVYPGSTSTTGTGSSSRDFAYFANSASGTTSINGYALSGGTLVAATGSPFSLGFTPEAMVINPANTFLYVASDSALNSGQGLLYGYTIGTGGALTVLSGGTALESESIASMDISPDGQWLFALDINGTTMEEYKIASTGTLTFQATYTISGAANGIVTPVSVKFAPSANFIVCALGTGGAETFSFNTSTGLAAPSTLISPASAAIAINGVGVDSNNYLYAVGTAGLQVFSTTSAGRPTLVSSTAYSTGKGPVSVVISKSGSFLYVANQSDATISGFAIGSAGALTTVTGSPFVAPTLVSTLGRDNSGSYILASGYSSSSGFQMFSQSSAGVLTLTSSVASGTSSGIPAALAVAH